MGNIKQLMETLKKNQEIAQKFFEIETSVLSILNFKDFLERLLTEIQDKMEIPYTWISLIDKTEFTNMVQKTATSDILTERTNIIGREIFLKIIRNTTDPLLVNSDLTPYHALIPKQYKDNIRSLAIVPLTLDGNIIGSMNQADSLEVRYQPDMDTTLLKRLATIVSICLSNVMAHERLHFLASRDPLTGLLNRRVLEQILDRECERAARYGTPLTILFMDVDDFKIANDRYGHQAGDDVLKYVAANSLRMTRKTDIVARYAGDEFVIVLPSTPINEANEFAKRLKSFFVTHPLDFEGTIIPVSISYGLSSAGEGIDGAKSLLKKADSMLYKAKKRKSTRRSHL